jgi:uncharacterized damage-inducible protein DinB
MSATPSPIPGVLPSSPAEVLFGDFAAEHASTRRLLACVPDGHVEWRPHPRSRTLGELATHVADIPNRGVELLGAAEFDVTTRRPPAPLATAAELLAHHDASVARLGEAIARADAARIAGESMLRAGPKVLVKGPRYRLLRVVVMSHLVHHRAQLGVYLRLLDVHIPGMYGPSADDPGPLA